MNRVCLLCFLSVIVWTMGCGGSGKKKAKAVPVKGTITLNGSPLPDGEISLLVAGESPSLIVIKNGAFSGTANIGSNKVEIRAFKDGPPLSTDPDKKPTRINYLPDQYGFQSTLKAEVTEGGSNDFPFTVTTR